MSSPFYNLIKCKGEKPVPGRATHKKGEALIYTAWHQEGNDAVSKAIKESNLKAVKFDEVNVGADGWSRVADHSAAKVKDA